MGKQRLSIIPAAAVADKNLSLTCLRVLGQIGTYTDDNGWCFPRQVEIAGMLGIGRETVNRAVKKLAEHGYLEVHNRQRRDGGKAANFYRVILDPAVPPSIPDDELPDDGPGEEAEQGEVDPGKTPPPCDGAVTYPCDGAVTRDVTSGVTGDVIAGVTSVTTHLNDPLEESARAWSDTSHPPEPSALRTALKRLSREIGKDASRAWLDDLVIVSADPPRLQAPNRFKAIELRQRYGTRIEDLLGGRFEIEVTKTHGVRPGKG